MRSFLSHPAKGSETTGKKINPTGTSQVLDIHIYPHAFKMEMRYLRVLVFDLHKMSLPPWQWEYFADQLLTC